MTPPYRERLIQLQANAEAIAQATRDRLDLRAEASRELSAPNREQLTEIAIVFERLAADLRALAQPEAGLSRYLDRLARKVTA